MVTGTVVVLDSPPLVPVTDTLNGATPVAHVTESTAPVKLAVQPTGTVPAEKVTVPENPLIGVTVTVEVPATVASVVIAGAESAKSWTVTGTFTVLTRAGVTLVPVTVTLKVATGEQFTDTTLPDRVTVHPVGAVEVKANATVPEKPLMLFTVIVDVLVTPATILNEAGLAVKEKS